MRIETLIMMCSFFNINCALKWVSTGLGNINDSFISLERTRSDIKIDLSEADQVTILREVRHWNWTIIVYCSAISFNEKSRLEFYFCDWSKKCVDSKSSQWTDYYGIKFNIEELSGSLKGIKVNISPLVHRVLYFEYFYNCKAVDTVTGHSIQTNFVYFRDVFYFDKYSTLNLGNNSKSIYDKVITKRALPLTFSCFTDLIGIKYYFFIYQEFCPPVFWAVCPVKKDFKNTFAEERVTFSKCAHYLTSKWDKGDPKLKPEDIRNKAEFTTNIDHLGNLHIFDIKYQQNDPGLTYAVMCYRKKDGRIVPIKTYVNQFRDDEIISGVIFDFSVTQYRRTLSPISKKLQQAKIYQRQVPKYLRGKDSVTIYASYKSSSNVQYKWFHNGIALKKTDDIDFDGYRVSFVGDIKAEHKGNYTLKVWDKIDELVFTIIVTLNCPLTLINRSCLPPLKHVWEFEDLSLQCEYSSSWYFRNDLLINDLEIAQYQSDMQNKLNLKWKYPHLNGLQFIYGLKEDKKRETFTLEYSVHNMSKSRNEMRYQDHSVTFKGKHSIQSIVRSSSIYVVPKVHLQITQFPLSTNCTQLCNSSKSHIFKCRFNADQYKNKGLIVDHYWSINNQRLDNSNSKNIFTPYFKMDSQTKDLELLPIHSSNTKQNDDVIRALRSNYLVCHIDLKSVDESTSKFQYRSEEDVNIKEKLKAKIEMEYMIPISHIMVSIPDTDYVRWVVVAIIIGIIIMIIGFVVAYRDRLNKVVKCFRSQKKDERLEREMEDKEKLNPAPQIEKHSKHFVHMPGIPKRYGEGRAKATTSA